jgi:hypothetical protein
VLGGLYELVAPHLTEKQRRLLAGAAAEALGRGGGARMARISGLSRPTVYTGVRELEGPPDPRGRVRRPGGGPKRLAARDPGLLAALEGLLDPDTRETPKARCAGRPSRPASSPRRLARKGSRSPTTPSGGCSSSSATRCSAPRKPRRVRSIPAGTRGSATSTSRPSSIWPTERRSSAWIPRKRSWSAATPTVAPSGSRSASPSGCWSTTSPTRSRARRSPTGSTTWAPTPGWVSVGTDHDTAAFAVATLRRWWQQTGPAGPRRA